MATTPSVTFAAPKRYPIFDTYVNALSLEETVTEVEKIVQRAHPVQHVVLNASKINLMRGDPKLAAIINECPLINADGASIVWAGKMLGVPLAERVTGIDLFLKLVEIASEKNYGIYLFGAEESVVTRTRDVLVGRFPQLRVVGCRNGYFDASDDARIVEDMSKSGADMLFVAFSSPKKEYWIHEHLADLNIPFVMGVGGSFDVVAGVTSRAPAWMQGMGLEWLFRLMQEPGRLWKRYMVGNVRFVLLTCRYMLSRKVR